MAILGINTDGGSVFPEAAGRKIATKATLGTAQQLQELHAIVGGVTSQRYVLHIHADSSGVPGALLAYTSPISYTSGTHGEISQTGFAVALAAGTYWLGVTAEVNGGEIAEFGASGETRGILSGATFSPPSNPFGTTGYGPATRGLSIWAVVGASSTTWNSSATVSLTDTITTNGTRVAPTSHASATVTETVTITTSGVVRMVLTPKSPGSLTLLTRSPDSLVLIPRPTDSLVLTPR